jgi:hypothetical protein
MPFGKVLKLLSVVFQRMFTNPDKVSNLSIQEDSLLPTLVENTGEPEHHPLSLPANEEAENSRILPSEEEFGNVVCQSFENRWISNLVTTTENTGTPLPKILEERVMIKVSMLQDELQDFISGSAEVQGAILASPDGLALASVLPIGMDEERTAAMSASMLSLGERIGRELARGSVDRIVVEGEKGYGVLVGCGVEAVLLVLASSAVKQGILFLEIKRAVAKITPLLA